METLHRWLVTGFLIASFSAANAEATPPGKRDFQGELNSGWAAIVNGDFDAAVRHYRRATILVADSEDAWLGLQLAHLSAERWDAALAAGRTALTLNPKSFWAVSRQAFANYKVGHYQRAQVLYDAALGINPDDPAMLLGLGFTRLARGDREGAKTACAQAERLLVDDPRVNQCLSKADKRSWHVSVGLSASGYRYSPAYNLEGLWAVGVTAAVDWDWGIGFWAGAVFSETQLVSEADDYSQQVPGFGLWVARAELVAAFGFAWLVSNDDAVDGTPVITGRLGYRGAMFGTGLAAAVSVYPEGPTVTQLEPWLEWRPNRWLSLQTGLTLGMIADPSGDETLVSGWVALGFKATDWLSLGVAAFAGPRRYRVEASGQSVWVNGQRMIGGYSVTTSFGVSEWLDIILEFRHDFGDERSTSSVPARPGPGPIQIDESFQLVGGTAGVRARF